MRRWMVVAIAVAVGAVPARSEAQSAGSATAQTARGESTVLVPPQGGTARIPVTPNTNVLLTFPEPLTISHTVIASLIWFTLSTAIALTYYAPTAEARSHELRKAGATA